jgi:hypothetical protein
VRLRNDTGQTVILRGCDNPGCGTSFLRKEVGPGDEADAEVDPDTLVQLFRIDRSGADECLPLRVHDAYQLLEPGGALTARLSQASPCPGTTVLPRPAQQVSL